MGTEILASPDPAASTAGTREGDGPRFAGLDGLRAVAVLAVMAFHFGAGWLTGGFFGVDIFYVLSGFLISGILIEEWSRWGRIRLGQFWARRARRLLPALALVLLAVTWYVHFVAPPGSYPGYRMDALSALFYFSNWHQIATSTNYFVATGLVSPLTHTWSLAIEEQFYLVWPLVTIAVLRISGGVAQGVRALLWLSMVGALASAALMAVLFSDGADTTRVYFGTDTHAQCILVGAALACAVQLRLDGNWRDALPRAPTGPYARLFDGAALAGLVGLAVLAHSLTGDSTLTYEGGFLMVAVATAAVVLAVVVVPRGLTARLLSVTPLPWIGRISYGMYLWHFPLAIYLTPARTGLHGLPLALCRVGATIGVSALSFYAVERPILERRFWRSARALVPAGVGAVVVTAVIVAATLGPAISEASTTGHRYRPSGGSDPAPPRRVVALGDSTAITLSYALRATAPRGTEVTDGGLFGCGLAVASATSANPPHPGLVLPAPCNSATPSDRQWPALDARVVAHTDPGDVVLFLAGHDDTQGTLENGTWTSILSPSFQHEELARLSQLVSIATAHGAHLDLLTMPCTDSNYQFNTPPSPTDSADRRELFNRLLLKTAVAHPSTVSVIDYGSMLCPAGRFTETLDGVQVRALDGIHTPAYAPGNAYAGNSTAAVAGRFYAWISPKLWPKIIAYGR